MIYMTQVLISCVYPQFVFLILLCVALRPDPIYY